jgi:hypothetical protein
MIDRAGRTAVSEQLRHLVAGQVTNDVFEDRLPVGSQDRGVSEVSEEAWYLYSDLSEHRLTGAERVPNEARRHVARWILFLHSDLEFEWPAWAFARRFSSPASRLLTFGLLGHQGRRRYEQAGDITLWPFLRRADYEAALARPRYLSGAAQQPDAGADEVGAREGGSHRPRR